MQDRIPAIDREGHVDHYKSEPVIIAEPTKHALTLLQNRGTVSLVDLAHEIQRTTPPIQTFFGGVADRLARRPPKPEALNAADEVFDELVEMGVATRINIRSSQNPNDHTLDTLNYYRIRR